MAVPPPELAVRIRSRMSLLSPLTRLGGASGLPAFVGRETKGILPGHARLSALFRGALRALLEISIIIYSVHYHILG